MKELTYEKMKEAIDSLKLPTMPLIEPSGIGGFILELGLRRIRIMKNEIMTENFAMLSPDIYEMIYSQLKKMIDEQEDKRSVATDAQ